MFHHSRWPKLHGKLNKIFNTIIEKARLLSLPYSAEEKLLMPTWRALSQLRSTPVDLRKLRLIQRNSGRLGKTLVGSKLAESNSRRIGRKFAKVMKFQIKSNR